MRVWLGSRNGRWNRLAVAGLLAFLAMLLTSCGNLGYLAHCARGHLGVMASCQPISEVLDDPVTPPELRSRLEKVLEIRDFASRELSLPDNESYRSYGDLGRPYVVWNVVAAPEFSLEPLEWCFPVAGCVSYRGYYDRAAAESFADGLRAEGQDVHVYGVPAYSTLSWFNDPVLNTFLERPEPSLAGTIFHELAHQVLYVKGDSRFNEAFATTVEMEGVKRWLDQRGDEGELMAYRERFRRHNAFLALVGEVRAELSELYDSGIPSGEMRQKKGELLEEARRRHEAFQATWDYGGYDGFFTDLNNARLVSVSTYRDLVPAFTSLLDRLDNDLPAFFDAAAELARLPSVDRHARLAESMRLAELGSQTEQDVRLQ